MENKLSVLNNVLKEYFEIDDTINNIFSYLFDCLRLINLNSNFNKA